MVSGQVNSYRTNWRIVDPPVTRAAQGLPERGTVYCDFNALYKVYPAIFDTWMEILRRVPHSVLWLLRYAPRLHAWIPLPSLTSAVAGGRG